MTKPKRGRGRPKASDLIGCHLNLPRALIGALDEKARSVFLSRSALVRQLLIEALPFKVYTR